MASNEVIIKKVKLILSKLSGRPVSDSIRVHAETFLFGDVYAERFKSLVDARIAVKEGRFDDATKLFDGKLKPYLNDKHKDGLADALKLVINIIYSPTFATHPNRFTDDRNIDNIVAK